MNFVPARHQAHSSTTSLGNSRNRSPAFQMAINFGAAVVVGLVLFWGSLVSQSKPVHPGPGGTCLLLPCPVSLLLTWAFSCGVLPSQPVTEPTSSLIIKCSAFSGNPRQTPCNSLQLRQWVPSFLSCQVGSTLLSTWVDGYPAGPNSPELNPKRLCLDKGTLSFSVCGDITTSLL